MDWYKAKNYTIVFLLLLNALLLGFNFFKRLETTLSSSRVQNITELMKKRNINIGCSLPNRFTPMSRIKMKSYDYDYMVLENVFFKSVSGISRTDDSGRVIFRSDEGELTVKGSRVSFATRGIVPADTSEALDISEEYVQRLNASFSKFSFDGITNENGDYCVKYYDEIYGYNIFSNYVFVTIDARGNISVEMNYYEPMEDGGEKNSVIAADEAIFSLSDLIKDKGVTIEKVQPGYLISENTGEEMNAVPVYCIRADGKTYYVNSVSGSVIS